jgi:hypothetical protein
MDQDTNGNISEPLSLHLYLYADGDPINHIDPSGDQADIAIAGAEIALAIAATVMVASVILANPHARVEIPFRVNHYTQWVFVPSILLSGLDRDKNYVTTDWYFTGTEAQ